MRILVVTNHYPPDVVGGYEKACADTVDFLEEQGHAVQILSRQWPESTDCTEAVSTSSIQRCLQTIDYHKPSYAQKWRVERHNYQLTRLHIQSFQPDLVYFWSQRGIGLTPIFAAEDAAVPRVFEMGDIWPSSYIKPGFKAALKRGVKSCLPGFYQRPLRLSNVISVSHWMAQELTARFRVDALTVIPNGTALPEGLEAPLPVTVAYSPRRALFAGRLDPEKGLHLALSALLELRRAGYDVSLDIAGTGDAAYIARCQQFVAEHQLEQAVRFLGWQDMTQIYPRYQVLLMPTCMREPFGLVLIEAMMHGLNVIAPNAYGPAEILNHGVTGWLFAPGLESEQTQRVQRIQGLWLHLIEQPDDVRQVALQARHQARSRYVLSQVKGEVLQVLKQVANVKEQR